MRTLIIMMVVTLMSLASCATKHKTKEVEKTEIKTENVLQNDSVFQLNSKKSKIETNQTFNEFEKVLKALNVQYDGDQDNELNVKGKGKANYNEQSEKTYNLTKSEVLANYDSLRKFELKQNKQERAQQLVDSFKSDTEKEKSDVSIWIYIVIGSVLVVGTIVYVGIRQIKK